MVCRQRFEAGVEAGAAPRLEHPRGRETGEPETSELARVSGFLDGGDDRDGRARTTNGVQPLELPGLTTGDRLEEAAPREQHGEGACAARERPRQALERAKDEERVRLLRRPARRFDQAGVVRFDADEERVRLMRSALEDVASVARSKVDVEVWPFGTGLDEVFVETFELLARDQVHGGVLASARIVADESKGESVGGGVTAVRRLGLVAVVFVTWKLTGGHDGNRRNPRRMLREATDFALERVQHAEHRREDGDAGDRPDGHFLRVVPGWAAEKIDSARPVFFLGRAFIAVVLGERRGCGDAWHNEQGDNEEQAGELEFHTLSKSRFFRRIEPLTGAGNK